MGMPKQAAALAVYELTNAVPQIGLEQLRRLNTSHYLDDQDCKYVGHRMLCSGVTEMRVTSDTPLVRLGGLYLVSLTDGRPPPP
jgi:hypothetical protein